MTVCVDIETAIKSHDAGIEKPAPAIGQYWYLKGLGTVNGEEMPLVVNYVNMHENRVYFSAVGVFVENRGNIGMSLNVQSFMRGVFAPTDTQIIDQMPHGTRIETQGNDWVCRYPMTGVYDNCIWDTCPHVAAAKAFIAWKKGMK